MNPCYAIIPAAGRSRRMGQHKLLMPWPVASPTAARLTHRSATEEASTARCVIDRVLAAWTTSRVTETIVVIRGDDLELRDVCQRWPVTIVHPIEPTEDMRASICVGLRSLISRPVSAVGACFFIAPADLPGLTTQVIDGLIDARTDQRTVLLPRFGPTLDASIVGHPALLPWACASEIIALGPQHGVDALVKRYPQQFVLFPSELAVADIDTPAEYQLALRCAKLNP
ncbi:MAG: NTP transferase domain-containing protein [Pirellulaceae bacterium]|nr:NTP transferase domain-containing protein [Pirellulaceae bacterium]